jgi:hypothetical protein
MSAHALCLGPQSLFSHRSRSPGGYPVIHACCCGGVRSGAVKTQGNKNDDTKTETQGRPGTPETGC